MTQINKDNFERAMRYLKKLDELIKRSHNPYFFFDDDPDGLSSFLLLYKKYQKGKFSVVRGKPQVGQNYLNVALRNNADLIVILDKPEMNEEFEHSHVPIVWIDHHPPIKTKAHYFNPLNYSLEPWPTTFWVYQMVKQWKWIAAIGIVGDWYILDVVEECAKDENYAWMFDSKMEIGELSFNSSLGKLIRLFGFILKGNSRDVKRDIVKLAKIDDPKEILLNFERAKKIEKEYNKILNKALKRKYDNCVFFFYESKFSFTGLLSNELLYRFPEKDIIVVGRRRVYDFSLSLRSKKYRVDLILKDALKGIRGDGGGHKYACGARVNTLDIDRFLENICNVLREIKREKNQVMY